MDALVHNGYVVVPNVLSTDEVATARAGLHAAVTRITGRPYAELVIGPPGSGRASAGPAAGIVAPLWKMRLHTHPAVVRTYREAYAATFGTNAGLYTHRYGDVLGGPLPIVDRVACRFPGEAGLGMHVDLNPLDPSLGAAAIRWRPLQSMVCLTDHFGSTDGGLQVVRGFHHQLGDYLEHNAGARAAVGTKGEFFRFAGRSHDKLRSQLETVLAPAGSMVLWDRRLPHATTPTLSPGRTREVVYTGFLPNVPLNQRYTRQHTLPQIQGAADRDWDMGMFDSVYVVR
jgi:hypothetical protein